jgi:hypothetical protein
MEKIYLFDDNQDNSIENYHATYIKDGTYGDILEYISKLKICEKDGLTYLSDAKCILIHTSFPDFNNDHAVDGSSILYQIIVGNICDYGDKIPLVCFSGADQETCLVNSTFMSQISKRNFYKNLKDFLNNYQENKTINLKILKYGKDYILEEAKGYAYSIFKALKGKESDVIPFEKANSIKEFRLLIQLSYNSENKYDEIINDLEDNPITIKEFKDKINKLISSFTYYGKNIYNW